MDGVRGGGDAGVGKGPGLRERYEEIRIKRCIKLHAQKKGGGSLDGEAIKGK